jgi:DNA replication protein DnaC
MLNHQLEELLENLRLFGAKLSLEKQLEQREHFSDVSFLDRLTMILEDEKLSRSSLAIQSRLKKAKLRQSASIERIDVGNSRGIDRAMLMELESCRWIDEHKNILIAGATGVGKSFLACAIGHRACVAGFSTTYIRSAALFTELGLVRGSTRMKRYLQSLCKPNLLIIDDWGLEKLNADESCELLEIIEGRYDVGATVITSQMPVENWFGIIENPTIADAILDRLVHRAFKIRLTGSSKRAIRPVDSASENQT